MARQRKRKRSESPKPNASDPFETTPNPQPPPTRSTDFYYDDGNIVLIAENVAFRVYKGQLARHSEVFRDMFSTVSQPEQAETVDGCPAVRLSDAITDVTALLRALYDNTQFDPENITLLTTVLRMATKYLVDPLRRSCIEVLRKVYPDSLSQWDQWCGERWLPELVVQLVDVEILLPAAFYCLCGRTLNELKLPPHLLEVYCKGKETVTGAFMQFFSDNFEDGHPCDTSGNICHSAWEFLEEDVLHILHSHGEMLRPQPLQWIGDLSPGRRPGYYFADMCGDCKRNVRLAIRKARLATWESLPKAFGLGSWKELRERHKSDLLPPESSS